MADKLNHSELEEFRIWKHEQDEKRRKKGAYWLTPEGRAEIRDTWERPDDNDELVLVLLNELERVEDEFAGADKGETLAQEAHRLSLIDNANLELRIKELEQERDDLNATLRMIRLAISRAQRAAENRDKMALSQVNEYIQPFVDAFMAWVCEEQRR